MYEPVLLFVTLAVSLGSSILGAICGIGGGVIIKPVLDSCGIFEVGEVTFLSGCTVLAMSIYSVLNGSRHSGDGKAAIQKTAIQLGAGAVLGGVSGKYVFEQLRAVLPLPQMLSAIQAIVLFCITLATLWYTRKKGRIYPKCISLPPAGIAVGFSLGLMSAFLGIGGGPINLVALHYFYAMDTKEAAQNSLCIIMLSQGANLIASLATGQIPTVNPFVLAGMILCGILGAAAGRRLNKRLSTAMVDRLFCAVLVCILVICIYNFWRCTN